MFELKITTNTAAEARQDLEQFLGRLVQGEVLTTLGSPERDAKIDAEIQLLAKENQYQKAELIKDSQERDAMRVEIERQRAEIERLTTTTTTTTTEAKRSHKAKFAALIAPAIEAIEAIEAIAAVPAAPPWIQDDAALVPPEPASIEPAAVRLALADLAEAKGRAALEAILGKFNAKSFSKLDPTTFEDVLEAVAQVMKP